MGNITLCGNNCWQQEEYPADEKLFELSLITYGPYKHRTVDSKMMMMTTTTSLEHTDHLIRPNSFVPVISINIYNESLHRYRGHTLIQDLHWYRPYIYATGHTFIQEATHLYRELCIYTGGYAFIQEATRLYRGSWVSQLIPSTLIYFTGIYFVKSWTDNGKADLKWDLNIKGLIKYKAYRPTFYWFCTTTTTTTTVTTSI